MACKNNKRNKRRATFYEINKFDYETREKLVERHLLPKEILTEEEKNKKVKSSPGSAWTKAWAPKITTIQITSQKA